MAEEKNQQEKVGILVVEDGAQEREELCGLLCDTYEVMTAASGREALETLSQRHDEIMLVLMDILLPDISGFDVLREMAGRSAVNDIPVVMISSEKSSRFTDQALMLGAADYIIRPDGMAFLKKRLKNCLATHSRYRMEIERLNRAADQGKLKTQMKDEAFVMDALEKLELVNDMVRLVDVNSLTPYIVTMDGHICRGQKRCYEFWNRSRRCENCIGARCFADMGRHSKYEFAGGDIYHATAKYIEVNGVPFALEMLSRADDTVFMDAFGKQSLIQTILAQNEKMYVDALTGAYNRHYFEEQLSSLKITALAMIDIDFFKSINDTYGHLAGDMVLKAVAATLKKSIRGADVVIRYGGDEFLVAFADIPTAILGRRLEQMKDAVAKLRFEEYPQLAISLSIGGTIAGQCTPEVIGAADKKLYEAKRTRNCVAI